MHAALGRSGQTISGDIRSRVSVWFVGEAILYEILRADVVRVQNKEIGFAFLEPGARQK
jgi:hypothetical protein